MDPCFVLLIYGLHALHLAINQQGKKLVCNLQYSPKKDVSKSRVSSFPSTNSGKSIVIVDFTGGKFQLDSVSERDE